MNDLPITPDNPTDLARLERLLHEESALANNFGYGAFADGRTRERLESVRAEIAAVCRPKKSAGQIAYEQDLAAKPTYGDGSPRRTWDRLGDVEKLSWERNPTPRWNA